MKLPKFKTEEEEIKFWDTHSLTDYIDDTEEVKEPIVLSEELKSKILSRRKLKKPLTLRLDPELIERTKLVAQKKAVGYQTLMRMWIAEGLNRETRRRSA